MTRNLIFDPNCAVVATTHPAKFEGLVKPLIERPVPLPSPLTTMFERPAKAEPLAAGDEALKLWPRAPFGP